MEWHELDSFFESFPGVRAFLAPTVDPLVQGASGFPAEVITLQIVHRITVVVEVSLDFTTG